MLSSGISEALGVNYAAHEKVTQTLEHDSSNNYSSVPIPKRRVFKFEENSRNRYDTFAKNTVKTKRKRSIAMSVMMMMMVMVMIRCQHIFVLKQRLFFSKKLPFLSNLLSHKSTQFPKTPVHTLCCCALVGWEQRSKKCFYQRSRSLAPGGVVPRMHTERESDQESKLPHFTKSLPQLSKKKNHIELKK